MLCKALSIPKNSRISRVVFYEFVGSSLLSLLSALKDLSNVDGVSSKLKALFILFNPPNFSLNVFGANVFSHQSVS